MPPPLMIHTDVQTCKKDNIEIGVLATTHIIAKACTAKLERRKESICRETYQPLCKAWLGSCIETGNADFEHSLQAFTEYLAELLCHQALH